MKGLFKDTIIYAFALFLAVIIFPGIHITGGAGNYLIGGLALTLLMLIVKPILTIITFPINVITLGLFAVFTNVIILYLLTIFVPSILIGSFHVSRTTISGIIIPAMEINKFFAFCVIAAFISMLTHFIEWLTE